MSKTDKMDFYDIFPIALTVLFIIIVIILRVETYYTGGYEYETIDGEKGTAVLCETPYRGVPYCELDDGTAVYGIKKYKRATEEEE